MRELKAGERVRLKRCHRGDGYRAGDEGTVLKSLENPAGGATHLYVVEMDLDTAPTRSVFAAEEIEPDL